MPRLVRYLIEQRRVAWLDRLDRLAEVLAATFK